VTSDGLEPGPGAGPPHPSRRAGTLLAKLLLAGLSLAVCAAVLEVAARISVHRREAGPHTLRSFLRYDPTLGWDKVPNEEIWLHAEEADVLFRTNAHGLRGPDRPYEKGPGVARVLLLGDSFTEAGAVEEERSVRAVLEGLLNGGGCRRYEVINAGTSGYSTDQEYLFFMEEGRRYQPDVVVLMFFSNDLAENMQARKKPWFELDEDRLILRNSPVPPPPEEHRRRLPDPPRRLKPWRGSYALRLLGVRTESGNPRLHRLLKRLGLVPPPDDHPPGMAALLWSGHGRDRETLAPHPGPGPGVGPGRVGPRIVFRGFPRSRQLRGGRPRLAPDARGLGPRGSGLGPGQDRPAAEGGLRGLGRPLRRSP
jgi:GDSL-like lipase/acylhydrolase family protein